MARVYAKSLCPKPRRDGCPTRWQNVRWHEGNTHGAGQRNVRRLLLMGEEGWCVAARKIGGCRAFWTVLAGLFLLVLAVPSGAFASARITPRDRAATRAYLEARYVYVQALVASAPAAKAAEEEFVSILGGECPGVLAGAPQETLRTLFASSSRARTPRQMGEANRESRQLGDLECPRFRGHLSAWVRRTRQEGCGVHATYSSPVPRGVPS